MVSACCRVVLPPLWHIITPPFTPYHVIPNRPDHAALRAGSLWMAAWADAPLDGVETHPNLVGLGVVDCLPPGFAAAAYRAAGLSICQRRGILSVTTSAPPPTPRPGCAGPPCLRAFTGPGAAPPRWAPLPPPSSVPFRCGRCGRRNRRPGRQPWLRHVSGRPGPRRSGRTPEPWGRRRSAESRAAPWPWSRSLPRSGVQFGSFPSRW